MENNEGLRIDLTGHLALVTGASGELGRTIARTLAHCGADVAVHYHRGAEKAEALVKELQPTGRTVIAVPGDVTREADVMQMRDAIERGFGRLPDVVVANAVIQYNWTSILEQSVEDFEGQFRSCSLQSVLLAKAFVPTMQEKQWGRFIAINTECAMQCFAGQGAYASAKRGLDGVMRVLAREVGKDGITVNQVAPGWMISDKARDSGTEHQPGYESSVPLRRRGEDRDIANAVAFLASDLAAFVSGVYLPVCGGNVMPTI